MRFAPVTASELRNSFGRVMKDIRAGRVTQCPDGLGFDMQTWAAINAFAMADTKTAVLADAAQQALARQLAGANALADMAELQQLLEES